MRRDADFGFLYSLVLFGFGFIDSWKRWLMPALSDTVDKMIARKDVPIRIAEHLDDIGHFLQRLAGDIMEARRGIGLPVSHEPKTKQDTKTKDTAKREPATRSDNRLQA